MATAQSDPTSQDLRCNKCRTSLSVSSDHVQNLEGKNLDQTLIFLREDSLPEWIELKVEECAWTKTKLHCPSCGVRVGGIDYVGGADHPVHLIKSKVDLALSAEAKEELRKLLNPTRLEQPAVEEQLSVEQTLDSPTPVVELHGSESDESSTTSSLSDDSDESDTSSAVTDVSLSSENVTSEENSNTSSSSEAAMSSSSSSEIIFQIQVGNEIEEDISADEAAASILSKKQRNKLRLKRRRIEKLNAQRKRKNEMAKQDAEKQIIQNILEAEPELDDLDHALICPVCLDLLYEPYKVDPCKHIFCEPCLRRLGSKNPMNTSCPMCRQRIVYCEPQREFSRTIRDAYQWMYVKRKKFERSTNVFTLPLPWRPGWRNLISGRAMGGNRMANETNAEAFRQFLQQLPYYIPPVVIANLINLLFFICLLGAVEIVPLLFSLIMGRGPMGMSALSKAAVNQVVDAPMVSMNAEQIDVETSSPVEDIMRDALQEDDDDAMLGEIPLVSQNPSISHTFALPESTSPAMDATFYYVLCTMSLMAAAFGNFLIVQQQPLFAIIPQGTFFDRLYHHPAFGRHFQRFSDLFLIIGLSCLPILLLPLVLQSPSELRGIDPIVAFPPNNEASGQHNDASETSTSQSDSAEAALSQNYKKWLTTYFRSFIQILILMIDSVNSVMTFQNIVSLAIVYYVTCTFFNYRGIGAN